jgi:hypothetical protein
MHITDLLAIAAITVVPALAVAPAVVRDLGINCRGRAPCGYSGRGNEVEMIAGYINSGIDSNRHYSDGSYIACSNRFCAFLQGTNGGRSGGEIRVLIQSLADRCKRCGSVPVDYLNSSDPGDGMLTVNYVDGSQCDDGLCPLLVAALPQGSLTG